MYKRVALVAVVAMFMAVEVQAGRFGRGGCANGQCGMQQSYYQPVQKDYQPTQKVVANQSTSASTKAVVQASASESAAPEVREVPATSPQMQQVASQSSRSRIFRRWSR